MISFDDPLKLEDIDQRTSSPAMPVMTIEESLNTSWLEILKKWSFCIIIAMKSTTAQRMGTAPYDSKGLCVSMQLMNIASLKHLRNCVMVHGNLKIVLLERTKKEDFRNISFPNLREVTGFMLVYRVSGLESLGDLFPNLARIRGEEVLGNYGLIVHDIQNLAEVGLYNLLKIDRGGVIVWGGHLTCYVETVDWKTIAPKSRHVLIPSSRPGHCNIGCRCSRNATTNHCWNNRKCQRYLSGPDGEKCHEQCFGCRKTNPSDCSVCRHYTYQKQCVASCPNDTILLEINKYCLTVQECQQIRGFAWNGSCVFHCPISFQIDDDNTTTCKPCKKCDEICPSLTLITLRDIKSAMRCVYINGSLTIHVRAIEEAMEELTAYLSRIEEVADYVHIYGSITITSLDFLSSLKRIRGNNLKSRKYSLLVYDILNLQSLFSENVTKTLIVDKGTLRISQNPMLCTSLIDELREKFPVAPNAIDVPQGMNGYSAGGCKEVAVGLQVRVVDETTALVMFSPVDDPDLHYSILYVRVSPTAQTMVVPESCSKSEWFAVNAPFDLGHSGVIELNSLRPASTYAICVESYNPSSKFLARSPITNFSTPVGTPAPPFISELVAATDNTIVIRWTNHKDYKRHITHFQLDVTLIDMNPEDAHNKNHCQDLKNYDDEETERRRHAIVRRPPSDYEKSCESMCGVLSTVTQGELVEEEFDICSSLDKLNSCDIEEDHAKTNITVGDYIKTIILEIGSSKNEYQVGGLAPYRDYRFRLRSCTANKCSRSAREVVRTLRSEIADIVTITTVTANENGELFVKWKPPVIFNGAVLAYLIHVSPERSYSVPATFCASNDKVSYVLRSEKTKKYFVRVCTASLAAITCSEWEHVTVSIQKYPTWFWSGLLMGFILCIGSPLLAKLWKYRIRYSCPSYRHNDNMLLIDSTSMYRNVTEPPSIMMSDFSPIYPVSLSEYTNVHLDY